MSWKLRFATRLIAAAILLRAPVFLFAAEPPAGPQTLENLIGDSIKQVPNENEVNAARDLVKQAYEDDYATAVTDPEPLLNKLLASARQAKNLARKYAILLEAEGVATAAGDFQRAMRLIDARSGEFAIDRLGVRIEMLNSALTAEVRRYPVVLERLYDAAISTAELCAKNNAFSQAKAAIEVAEKASSALAAVGKSKKNLQLAKDGESKREAARGIAKDLDRRSDMLSSYQKGLEVLKAKPSDPHANGAVGRYLCFELNDWEKGLPALSKGEQSQLADAATMELANRGTGKQLSGTELFEIAGQWWSLAEKPEVSVDSIASIKRHAASLYASASESLTDPLEKAVAQKRSQKTTTIPAPAGIASSQGDEGKSQEDVTHGRNAFHESMLGVYMLDAGGRKQLPFVNAVVPNGENVLTDRIRESLGVDTYTLVFFATGSIFIPADGKYLVSCNQFLTIDKKSVGEFMNKAEIELKRGRHSVLLETRNNGGQLPRAVVSIVEKRTGAPVPIYNSLEDINRFLSTKITGQTPREVSGWQPTLQNRVRIPVTP
jgi:hypothetical protein